MKNNDPKYVEELPSGGYRVAGSRVGLESVVLAYLDGRSAEAIQDDFPSLSLEAIHGTIAFYLNRRDEVDKYLMDLGMRLSELRATSEAENAPLLARLRSERRNVSAR